MFNFLKKKKKKEKKEGIYALATGTVIPLSEVPDEVFSMGMMGQGLAIQPKEGTIYAPMAAKVKSVFPTKHALGLETASGIEILLHFGIDTVELKGAPFEIFVQEGQEVNVGDKLATMDLAQLATANTDSDLMMIFTNAEQYQNLDITHYGAVEAKAEIGSIEAKA